MRKNWGLVLTVDKIMEILGLMLMMLENIFRIQGTFPSDHFCCSKVKIQIKHQKNRKVVLTVGNGLG